MVSSSHYDAQTTSPVPEKKGPGRPRKYERDADDKPIIPKDEDGNLLIPKSVYKKREPGCRQGSQTTSTPAPKRKAESAEVVEELSTLVQERHKTELEADVLEEVVLFGGDFRSRTTPRADSQPPTLGQALEMAVVTSPQHFDPPRCVAPLLDTGLLINEPMPRASETSDWSMAVRYCHLTSSALTIRPLDVFVAATSAKRQGLIKLSSLDPTGFELGSDEFYACLWSKQPGVVGHWTTRAYDVQVAAALFQEKYPNYLEWERNEQTGAQWNMVEKEDSFWYIDLTDAEVDNEELVPLLLEPGMQAPGSEFETQLQALMNWREEHRRRKQFMLSS